MDYSKMKKSDGSDEPRRDCAYPVGGSGDSGIEVSEPRRDYMYSTGGGAAVEETDDLDDEDDGIDWSGLPAHMTFNSKEELYRTLIKDLDDLDEEDDGIPIEDVFDEIRRDIINGTI